MDASVTVFPYWLVTPRRAGGWARALTTRVAGQRVLPVFGFREEAQMFIYLAAPEGVWRARRTSAGELISLLYGPCSGVAGVVLDPSPGLDADGARHTPFGRREFVEFLLQREQRRISVEQRARAGRPRGGVRRATVAYLRTLRGVSGCEAVGSHSGARLGGLGGGDR